MSIMINGMEQFSLSKATKGERTLFAACSETTKLLDILSHPGISLADIQGVLSLIKSNYCWRAVVDCEIFTFSEQADFVRKQTRILKSYHETMRAFGYVHPKQATWQASRQIRLPIDVVKKIAFVVAKQQS